jgi:HEPN domain-containing protein
MNKEVQMWLRRAKSSLVLSKTPKGNDIFYEDLCFDAQQSAEKSLKALIIHQGLKPPKTHSFRVLINEI